MKINKNWVAFGGDNIFSMNLKKNVILSHEKQENINFAIASMSNQIIVGYYE